MTPFEPIAAIGVISGTSMDGIDVAALITDGVEIIRRGPGATYAYPPEVRDALIALVSDPHRAEQRPERELISAVTDAHVEAAQRFIADKWRGLGVVQLAGFHGQTVLHRPERRLTRQLFDGARAARSLGIDVVCDFRQADVAAGGQGAPLVPLYHQALVRAAAMPEPVMVLNLGGVGNVTYIDSETVIAFDTGPASALIDDWVRGHGAGDYDPDGSIARSGQVNHDILQRLLCDPYFAQTPPKSLDRNHFHRVAGVIQGMSLFDGAATLTAFTVAATAAAVAQVPRRPQRWLVGGGGRHNGAIMDGLRAALGVPVEPVDNFGWDGDHLEAECFAFLAVRSLRGLPLSLPSTTGVPRPLTGGEVFRK